MAGNQREMKRKEKKAQKERKNKIIAWTVIAVVIVVLIIMRICEININSVKDYFTDENGNISIGSDSSDSSYPYNIDSSQGVTIKNVNNKLAILTPTSFTILDTKKAKAKYTFEHGYSNPILKSSGIYSLIYDQGGKSFRLDDTAENIYEHENKSAEIFCAAVAKNGTVVCAESSDEKKCEIKVYNRSLDEKMSVGIEYGYVVAVAINNSGSKISFVAVNSSDARLKYRLYTMKVGDKTPIAKLDLPLGNIIDLHYNSDNLYVIGDDFVSVAVKQKSLKTVYESGNINTVAYTFTQSDELVLIYNTYANSTSNKLVLIRGTGKIKKEISVEGTVTDISASSNAVSVLSDGNIITYTLSSFKQKDKTAADDSVKSICRMGSSVYVHKQSLIDKSGE